MPAEEEEVQDEDSIRDVEAAIVVGIGGFHAWWIISAQEEEVQDVDAVRDVDGPVSVGVAAVEALTGPENRVLIDRWNLWR